MGMQIVKKFGLVILVIGQRRIGKTTTIKKMLKFFNTDKYIFDLRCEYYKDGFDMTIDEFISLTQLVRDSCIVFEESTIFFKSSVSKKMRDILTGASHNRNVIFLAFHSYRAVPIEILELVDFIIGMRTKDRMTLLEEKYKDDPQMLDIFNETRNFNKFQYKIYAYG